MGSRSSKTRRHAGILLLGLGGVGFLACSVWWLLVTVLPWTWIVLSSASLLLIGWSTVWLLLRPRWWTLGYMCAATVAVPLMTRFVAQ